MAWTETLDHHGSHRRLIWSADGSPAPQAKVDAIIVPSSSAERLVAGYPPGVVPPEYTGGLGESGVAAIKSFVEAGGTLICLDQSGSFAIGEFKLPLRDVAREAGSDKFFCPGSILRVELDPAQPLSYGMSPHTAGFFSFSSAYEILAPRSPTDGHGGESAVSVLDNVQTVARYGARDLLLSGWLEGEGSRGGRIGAAEGWRRDGWRGPRVHPVRAGGAGAPLAGVGTVRPARGRRGTGRRGGAPPDTRGPPGRRIRAGGRHGVTRLGGPGSLASGRRR